MTAMLTAIGAVSLAVGGVGIMNIMLVTVTERRREIGVRLAVGASVRAIRWQFLLEAALIALVGGVLGVAAGAVGVWTIAVGIGWPSIMSAEVAAWAILLAAAAGLGFGYLPAHRASALDPIEALQIES